MNANVTKQVRTWKKAGFGAAEEEKEEPSNKDPFLKKKSYNGNSQVLGIYLDGI